MTLAACFITVLRSRIGPTLDKLRENISVYFLISNIMGEYSNVRNVNIIVQFLAIELRSHAEVSFLQLQYIMQMRVAQYRLLQTTDQN